MLEIAFIPDTFFNLSKCIKIQWLNILKNKDVHNNDTFRKNPSK